MTGYLKLSLDIPGYVMKSKQCRVVIKSTTAARNHFYFLIYSYDNKMPAIQSCKEINNWLKMKHFLMKPFSKFSLGLRKKWI